MHLVRDSIMSVWNRSRVTYQEEMEIKLPAIDRCFDFIKLHRKNFSLCLVQFKNQYGFFQFAE